jgi:LmbE family N-acetylglucosaminyl deacetylase
MFDKVMNDFPPDIIYTSWINDSHQDHVNVSKTTIAAARKNNCSLYMYEQAIPSGITPYAFRPQAFVDISDTIEIKIKSVLAYESQVQSFSEQWIQSISGRAAYMGFRINVKYAEAFEVIKEIKVIE